MAALSVNPTNLSGSSEPSVPVDLEVNVCLPRHDSKTRLPEKLEDVSAFLESQKQNGMNLAEVCVTGIPTEDVAPIEFYAVFDISGSMSASAGNNKSRLDVVKQCLKCFIDSLNSLDKGAVVAFGNCMYEVVAKSVMTPKAKSNALKKISERKTGGMTNMASALIPVLKEIQQNAKQSKISVENPEVATTDFKNPVLLIFSDGEINTGLQGKDLLERIKQLEISTLVDVTVIGIGSGTNTDFLTSLAKEFGGAYYQTDGSIDQTTDIMGSVLGGARSAIATEIQFRFSVNKGRVSFEDKYADIVKFDSSNDTGLVCSLKGGSLQAEEFKSMFVPFSEADAEVSVTMTGYDVKRKTTFSVTKKMKDNTFTGARATRWFMVYASVVIKSLVEEFDRNFDNGKQKAKIAVKVFEHLETKYNIDHETVKENTEVVEKLIESHSATQYRERSRKSAMASTTTTFRSMKSGGGGKGQARKKFKTDVTNY